MSVSHIVFASPRGLMLVYDGEAPTDSGDRCYVQFHGRTAVLRNVIHDYRVEDAWLQLDDLAWLGRCADTLRLRLGVIT